MKGRRQQSKHRRILEILTNTERALKSADADVRPHIPECKVPWVSLDPKECLDASHTVHDWNRNSRKAFTEQRGLNVCACACEHKRLCST